MTSYVSIPNSDVDSESPLTVALATAWRDNPIAITEGSSGAPKVQTAALEQGGGSEAVTQATIRAAAVGQAELKSTTQEVSMGSGSSGDTALSVGEYGFWPTIRASDTSSTSPLVGVFNTNASITNPPGTSTPYVHMDNTGTNPTQSWAKFRYMTASPPFDLGDGDIPLFVFALIENSTSKVISATTAIVPPWAYNGPTNITPTRRSRDGRSYKKVYIPDADQSEKEILRIMRLPLQARLAILGAWGEIEITQAMKNADIDLIPHPFISADLSTHTVVMLDPVDTNMQLLADMIEADESVTELLHDGNIIIGNATLNRKTPSGVMPVSFRFK